MALRPGPRVFLDTNVLFSSAYSASGAPRRLLGAAALGQIQPVVSRTVLDELVPNLRRKAPAALPAWERIFRDVPFQMAVEPSREEIERWLGAGLRSDAPIIAAAVTAGVDYFCTGDRRVLVRGRDGAFGGLQIVSPAELVRVLQEGGEGPKA